MFSEITNALLGGAIIGVSAVFLMYTLGRISGISGIASSLLTLNFNKDLLWRLAFIIGLLLGPVLYGLLGGEVLAVEIAADTKTIIVGGLLVGFGATLGSGCTSGHGVCGLARISPRSIVATLVFLSAAIITVYLSR